MGIGPGYIATSTSPAAVPASATTTIQTLNLPAGSYLIFARADVNSNAAVPLSSGAIACTLAAETDTQGLSQFFLGANGTTGETQPASWQLAHTFAAAGQATLSCQTGANWVGNVVRPTISAIRVTSIG